MISICWLGKLNETLEKITNNVKNDIEFRPKNRAICALNRARCISAECCLHWKRRYKHRALQNRSRGEKTMLSFLLSFSPLVCCVMYVENLGFECVWSQHSLMIYHVLSRAQIVLVSLLSELRSVDSRRWCSRWSDIFRKIKFPIWASVSVVLT